MKNNIFKDRDELYEKIFNLLSRKKMTHTQIAKELKIGRRTVFTILNERNAPNINEIRKKEVIVTVRSLYEEGYPCIYIKERLNLKENISTIQRWLIKEGVEMTSHTARIRVIKNDLQKMLTEWHSVLDMSATDISKILNVSQPTISMWFKEWEIEINEKATKKNAKPNGEAILHHKFLKYQAGAKDRNLSFRISKKLFVKLTSQNCHYCNSQPLLLRNVKRKNGNITFYSNAYANGIDRINSKKGYVPRNVVSCCTICNKIKLMYNIDDFLQKCRKISSIHYVKE
ncbi:hypothetical protein A9Q84_00150 [Halobacteriovorax marinus]|uniref:Uncharacterized protein n=1 Tax=Halobacteriovorax marinus TaxID=97084 RepID=A0A1Y5FDJ6_9BACT|nr:hypothetical protein A9Q84_00150 [Halobacteriovorax marinus]